jgi:hypothetical protein
MAEEEEEGGDGADVSSVDNGKNRFSNWKQASNASPKEEGV